MKLTILFFVIATVRNLSISIDFNVYYLFLKATGKILIDKVDIQVNPDFADVKYEVKDQTTFSVDAVAKRDGDDIVVNYEFIVLL
jgi:hypothetical protein